MEKENTKQFTTQQNTALSMVKSLIKNRRSYFLMILAAITLSFVLGEIVSNLTANKSPSVIQKPAIFPSIVIPQVFLPQKTANIPPEQTANWLLFTTRDYSFKYPTGAKITNGLTYTVLNKERVYGFFVSPSGLAADADPKWYSIELFRFKNIRQSATDEYLKTVYGYDKSTLKRYVNAKINGYSFEIVQDNYPYLTVIEVKNHILYVFRVVGKYGGGFSDYSRIMFDKLLSTLIPTGDLTPDLKITDFIRLNLPNGWTQKIINDDFLGSAAVGTLEVTSPYMVDSLYSLSGKKNAVSISFSVTLDGKVKTVDEEYQEVYDAIHASNRQAPGLVSGLTKTTIAGYPAVSSYYDFEGHSHNYSILNGNESWGIVV
ncbi:MAG: hypothetical protein HY425_03565, partial [Candidatus Levybacteria bacterium]|nr:hypothetical protein [Candidatus Levybacteria bacterium]